MSRRTDPIRIYAAQRAGMARRLVEAFGMTEARAEAAIRGWEREAQRCGVRPLETGYWTTAEAWITDGGRAGDAGEPAPHPVPRPEADR